MSIENPEKNEDMKKLVEWIAEVRNDWITADMMKHAWAASYIITEIQRTYLSQPPADGER